MDWQNFCHISRGDCPFLPLNFEDPVEESIMASLTVLCCEFLVENSSFLECCCNSLPHNIYEILLSRAVQKDCISSVVVLITNWPYRTISIKNLCPPNLNEFTMVYDEEYRKQCVGIKIKITTVILRSFLKVLEAFPSLRLKILDLRGTPMSDEMLAFFIKLMSKSDTLTDDYYILVDCYCVHATTCEELLKLLKNVDNKIHLHFNSLTTLSIMWINALCVRDLLEYVNPSDLVSLALYSTDICAKNSAPVLWKFSKLTELSIVFGLDFGPQHIKNIEGILPNIFNNLPLLIRLKLFYFLLTNNLHRFLPCPGIGRLQHLDLTDCKLSESDLLYLSTTPLKLKELHLNKDVIVTKRIDLLLNLLRSLSSTLTILELDSGIIEDRVFPSFVTRVLSLRKLRYLDLFCNQLSWKCLRDNISILGSMERLECVQLSDIGNETKYLREEIEDSLADVRNPPVLIKWTKG